MSVTVLTPANTLRLTTLAAVQAEIPMGEHLLFAESLIDQASAAIARYCGTILAQQKYREVQLGGFQTTALFLRYWPLVSVTDARYGTTAITDYRLESPETGMLYRRLGWSLPSGGEDEWQVEYVAGYILPQQMTPVVPLGPRLPMDLERATIEAIKVWFHERVVGSRIDSKTYGLTGDTIRYGIQASSRGLPALSKDLLAPWRRLRVA